MSERPAAISRTDEILLHLVDRVDALADVLAGRDGAPAAAADAPSEKPQPAKKAAAKKTSSKAKTVDVDGR